MSPGRLLARKERERDFLRKSFQTYIGVWNIELMKGYWAACWVLALIEKGLRTRGYGPDARMAFWETLSTILITEPEDSITEDMARELLGNLDRYLALTGVSS